MMYNSLSIFLPHKLPAMRHMKHMTVQLWDICLKWALCFCVTSHNNGVSVLCEAWQCFRTFSNLLNNQINQCHISECNYTIHWWFHAVFCSELCRELTYNKCWNHLTTLASFCMILHVKMRLGCFA